MDLTTKPLTEAPALEREPGPRGSRQVWIIGRNERAAFALLRDLTGGTFDFWRLAGPSRSRDRQEIASALDGKKVPLAKCGVTALRDAFCFIARLNTDRDAWVGSCMAERDRLFAAYAAEVCAQGEVR